MVADGFAFVHRFDVHILRGYSYEFLAEHKRASVQLHSRSFLCVFNSYDSSFLRASQ